MGCLGTPVWRFGCRVLGYPCPSSRGCSEGLGAGISPEMRSDEGVLGGPAGSRTPRSGTCRAATWPRAVTGGCGSGPSPGLRGESLNRGEICKPAESTLSLRLAPGCYFSAIYTQNSRSPPTTPAQPCLLNAGPILTWLPCWGIQHLGPAWGDGWETWVLSPPVLPGLAPWGDRPPFYNLLSFPQGDKGSAGAPGSPVSTHASSQLAEGLVPSGGALFNLLPCLFSFKGCQG